MKCLDCPRGCNTNAPFCRKSFDKIRIAKAMKFFGEEPVLCPKKTGCGAVFFSFCSLKCSFCQNMSISHDGCGKDYCEDDLVNLFKKIDASSVENIDLVTPTHYTTAILSALRRANVKKSVIWNTSGYERAENIAKMKGLVDIFLFDFKYFDNNLALKFSKAPDYFEVCLKALKTARELVSDEFENGIMKKGIVVRHLVLPGHIDDSKRIFDQLKANFGTDIFISIMSQYTPMGKDCGDENLNRKLKKLEYTAVVEYVKSLGFKNGFVQETKSATSAYIPIFDGDIFSDFEDKKGK
jgi:putative pyruvate formate lyase activating enzyme